MYTKYVKFTIGGELSDLGGGVTDLENPTIEKYTGPLN